MWFSALAAHLQDELALAAPVEETSFDAGEI